MTTGSAQSRARSSSLSFGLSLVESAVRARFRHSGRQFVFLSHPIDGSGAPNILVSVVEEFAERFGPARVHLVAPYVLEPQSSRLEELGIRVSDRMVGAGGTSRQTLIRLQLPLRRDDFVLMNTVAVPRHYQDAVLDALTSGRLEHACWFIHEDIAQHQRFAPHFRDTAFLRSVSEAVAGDQLTIFVPSKKLKIDYDALLGTTKVRSFLYRFDLPAKYREERA